jgi:hypothetical protein
LEIAVWTRASSPRSRCHLDDLSLGDVGSAGTDSRLLSAVLARGREMSAWLQDRKVTAEDVERDFPGSGWP